MRKYLFLFLFCFCHGILIDPLLGSEPNKRLPLWQGKILPPFSPEDERKAFERLEELENLISEKILSRSPELAQHLRPKLSTLSRKEKRKLIIAPHKNILDLENDKDLQEFEALQDQIILRNMGLVFATVKNSPYLFDCALDALDTAFIQFDVGQGFKFSTFYRAVLHHKKKKHWRGEIKKRRQIAIDENLDADKRTESSDCKETLEEIRHLLSKLTDRDRQIVEAYYGMDGRPPRLYREIGAEFSISKERARQIVQRALEEMRKQIR